MAQEKAKIADIDRTLYDFRNEENESNTYRLDEGLTPQIVEQISKEKNDPDWMREFRQKSLKIYNEIDVPNWGPSIDGLDIEHIATYVKPKDNKMHADWDDVPEEIKDTFDRLGIPEACIRSSSICVMIMYIPISIMYCVSWRTMIRIVFFPPCLSLSMICTRSSKG